MNNKLITELVTPFNENNEIDYIEFERLIIDAKNQGSDGIVVGGSTGEISSLTIEELINLIKISSKIDDLDIIINLGLNSTYKTIELINQVKEYKHNYLMVEVPNQEDIHNYFKEITDTFKKEKFILYNDSKRTITNLDKLINECPNIVGLKESSNYELVKSIKRKYPSFAIYSDDKNILEMLKAGASGVISVLSHLFGKDLLELINDYYNDIENLQLDNYIKELSDIVFCDTNPIPIKYALSKRRYNSMNLRLPLTPLSKDKRRNIDIIV